jgi:hypothetical protein
MKLGIEGGRLDERADISQVGGRSQDVTTQDQTLAASGSDQSEQHADGGGLAGTVGADEPAYRAGRNAEVQTIDHRLIAESLGEPGRRDGQGGIKYGLHRVTPISGSGSMPSTLRMFYISVDPPQEDSAAEGLILWTDSLAGPGTRQ